MKKVFLVAAALVALLAVGAAEAAPRERSATITRGRVAPHVLRVESGQTVTWRNFDAVARAVDVTEYVGKDGKKSDPAVESAQLAKYERGTPKTVASFSHAFVEPGTYRYKLAGASTLYTIVVDTPKAAPAKTKTPAAPAKTTRPAKPSATPTPAKPTATPTPVPSATPKAGSATSALARCDEWSAWREEDTPATLRIASDCVLASPGYLVELRPRTMRGDAALLVDRVVTPRPGAWSQQSVTARVEQVVPTIAQYREVVIMPDAVRVPVEMRARPTL